ncbi:RNA-directed DNA polymerase, eukaryota, reverse transcriptase zinc-binding domain protein [Tanacetum coccineum]|uniref:RNA-directed DNA polymerase, eukaryota, reverse transcriptase zinc-binding domain protein n=1 Tax=Tanacetum coccineum TaxID=301880 RepID=A0ABQ5DTZ0_9ASTR
MARGFGDLVAKLGDKVVMEVLVWCWSDGDVVVRSCEWEPPTSEFSLKRGWRQGDPLSPFLFIIVMEGLHIALKDGLVANMFSGVKVGSNGIHLSHLFYVDDVIIFSDWNQNDIDNIIRILNVFYIASGLKINVYKSNLYGVGVSSSEIKHFDFRHGMCMADCQDGKLASFLLVSLNRFLGSLGIYYLSIFKAPKVTIKDLESLHALFFSEDKKKLVWIKWPTILASFDKGGLGVVVKSIHGDEAGIDLRGCQTNGLWASIVGTINHLHSNGILPLKSIRFNVGDGSLIRFWKDTWLGDLPIYILIGSLEMVDGGDCCLRTLSQDGTYSVSNMRKHIDDVMLPKNLPCTRCFKVIPKNINIFMWRFFMDRLLDLLNLSKRGLDVASILCPSCNRHAESNAHVFFSCDTALSIWRLVCVWCNSTFPILNSCGDWDSWFFAWHASKASKDRAYAIFAASFWLIWRFRNNVTFNSQFMRKCDIFDNIRLFSFHSALLVVLINWND